MSCTLQYRASQLVARYFSVKSTRLQGDYFEGLFVRQATSEIQTSETVLDQLVEDLDRC